MRFLHAALLAGFLVLAFLALFFASLGGSRTNSGFGSCVGVVRLEGDIDYGSSASILSASSPSVYSFIDDFDSAQSNPRVKAVLLEVNSPGGSSAASKEAFDAVRNASKPVVAYIEDVGASGGYYVAAASSEIVANPNTLTGSIGARTTLLNYEGLFQKLGLSEESIKSGALKDIGTGARNLTPEERLVLQDIVDEVSANFLGDVRAARAGKLTPLFENALDARVLSAKQALAAGLVDSLGTRPQALRRAAELGGIAVGSDGKPDECFYQPQPSLLDFLRSAGASFGEGLQSVFVRATTPSIQ